MKSPNHNTIVGAITGLVILTAVSTFASQPEVQYEYEDDPIDKSVIEQVENFQQLGAQAQQRKLPIMLSYSTPWCEYCEALEKAILEPMLTAGDYDDRIIVRKLMVEDVNSVIDFNGKHMGATDFALQQNVNLYPTLIFYDDKGNEVAPRIIGITVLDFVPHTIDKAIQQSHKTMMCNTQRADC